MADIIFPGQAPEETLGVTWLPQNVNLVIWKGDKQEYTLKLTGDDDGPVDLTGSTADAVIRQSYDASTSYPFQCTITDPAGGVVRVYMSSAVSKTIPAGEYIWNFQVTDANGDVRTYLAGDVTVDAEVDA